MRSAAARPSRRPVRRQREDLVRSREIRDLAREAGFHWDPAPGMAPVAAQARTGAALCRQVVALERELEVAAEGALAPLVAVASDPIADPHR